MVAASPASTTASTTAKADNRFIRKLLEAENRAHLRLDRAGGDIASFYHKLRCGMAGDILAGPGTHASASRVFLNLNRQ